MNTKSSKALGILSGIIGGYGAIGSYLKAQDYVSTLYAVKQQLAANHPELTQNTTRAFVENSEKLAMSSSGSDLYTAIFLAMFTALNFTITYGCLKK